jgi:predicted RND superfamily exporter protein
LPGLARFVERWRAPILVCSLLVSVPLGWGLTRLEVDPALERLRPRGDGLVAEEEITERFGLPHDVHLVIDRGAQLEELLVRNEALAAALRDIPDLRVSAPSSLLPSGATQERRARALVRAAGEAPAAADAVDAAARAAGFVEGTFHPFRERLSTVLDGTARLTLEGYRAHGLDDLLGRFVARAGDELMVVTYITSESPAAVAALDDVVARQGEMQLTGLPVVNETLAQRFPRELSLGLGAGALVVLLLIWLEFRALVPTLLALVPTVLGLVWGLGALGWSGVVLDLFSVFAVLMFLGIGVDYGIHLVHPTLRARGATATRSITIVGPAMLLAGITTLVGFGTLIRSEYVPLYSLGMASVATIGMSLLAALFTLPALLVSRRSAP